MLLFGGGRKKRKGFYIPGMPGALVWVTIMSSTRIRRIAVSAADWIAWRLTRAGSITPAAGGQVWLARDILVRDTALTSTC